LGKEDRSWVQKIKKDIANILLATLRMSGTTLIWWESRAQVDLVQHCKIISSWVEFISAMRNKFYPLAYTQTSMIEWLHIKQLKGENIQAYTQ
jgi:hypothetical protein